MLLRTFVSWRTIRYSSSSDHSKESLKLTNSEFLKTETKVKEPKIFLEPLDISQISSSSSSDSANVSVKIVNLTVMLGDLMKKQGSSVPHLSLTVHAKPIEKVSTIADVLLKCPHLETKCSHKIAEE